MPLPPPPPPGPPPPPLFNAPPPVKSSKGSGAEPKNQLLADIRKGTGLKKVTTNDRSAPVIENKSNGRSGGGQINGGPPGLAGLFAGGMPVLKPARGGGNGGANKGPPFLPPNKRGPSQDDVINYSQLEFSSPKAYISSSENLNKGGLPAGFGTVRKGFYNDAIKAQAPQPPSSNMKPFNNARPVVPGFGPPLPNKPPGVKLNIPNKVTPPSNKPPPPPKSPAVINSGPPALPSKPPSCRRHQSFNEYDVRQGLGNRNHAVKNNNRPNIKINNANNSAESGTKTPSPPTINAFHEGLSVKQASFKNASTPNLAALGVNKAAPPPPQRDPNSAVQQHFHTVPKPPPPPNRTTPYMPKSSPACRPPPPPPNKILSPPQNPPPPPPPHRLNPPPPPPPPTQQSLSSRGVPISQNNLPPPPPIRNSSARNSFSGSYVSLNANNNEDQLESRVYHLFVSLNNLPAPDPFTNSPKNYASKNAQVHSARIAAPPIPTQGNTQLQLGQKLWANSTSEC